MVKGVPPLKPPAQFSREQKLEKLCREVIDMWEESGGGQYLDPCDRLSITLRLEQIEVILNDKR